MVLVKPQFERGGPKIGAKGWCAMPRCTEVIARVIEGRERWDGSTCVTRSRRSRAKEGNTEFLALFHGMSDEPMPCLGAAEEATVVRSSASHSVRIEVGKTQ